MIDATYPADPRRHDRRTGISQGFTADKTVVLANLTVEGERRGPHAFLMSLRERGQLVQGVSVGDMGLKTTGNDLDNAWIAFDNVRLPRSSLLNAHATVDEAGRYELTTQGLAPFEMIGQRLYTGRVAVAAAALSYRRKLFEVTKAYADAKPIWSPLATPDEQPRLSSIPQLRALFEEAEETAGRLEAYVGRLERELCGLLREGAVPDAALAHQIATAKVKAVEVSRRAGLIPHRRTAAPDRIPPRRTALHRAAPYHMAPTSHTRPTHEHGRR